MWAVVACSLARHDMFEEQEVVLRLPCAGHIYELLMARVAGVLQWGLQVACNVPLAAASRQAKG